jgi:CubicO group peptidase (beta-lactamase class C family)
MSIARALVRNRFIAICLLAIVGLCPVTSGNPRNSSAPSLTPEQIAKVDQYLTAEMASERIPGVEVGIYRRGQILLAKGYGLANVELNVPVKPETVFQSGSVGKQFVSAAVMMLVEKGKVSLDDSITKYFPDAPPSWKPILVENLLSHTSGLAEYGTRERIGPNGPFYLRLDFTEDELVKRIEALPIDFPVGSNWAYCNTNYVLLGILIHKVTGEFYADFLADRIFKPLGMTSTRLISDADIIPNRASGYRIHDDKLQNEEWVSPTFNSTGDGSLYFNVLDLAKWDGALYGTKLLKQSSLNRIWTIFPLNNGVRNPGNYGFGWWINVVNGHNVVEHSGSSEGFTCHISRYLDDNLTVVVLTNLSAGHSHPDSMVHEIAGLINPALMPLPPKEYKEVPIDPTLLDGYVGTYQLAPGYLVIITREADQLFVQPTAQPKVPMFPYGPRDFFLKTVDAQITFVTDSSGKATELIVHQGGRDEPAKRVTPTP